jgi:hypothetical protein
MVALCVLRVCLSVPAMCLNPESGRSKMYIGYMLWLNHFIYRCRTSFRWVCPAENSRCSNMFQTLWIGPASEKHWRALYVLEELSGWTWLNSWVGPQSSVKYIEEIWRADLTEVHCPVHSVNSVQWTVNFGSKRKQLRSEAVRRKWSRFVEAEICNKKNLVLQRECHMMSNV